MSGQTITLLRSGNRLVVDPSPPAVRDLLTPHLRYTERVYARGREARERRRAGRSLFEAVEWQCYAEDHKGRLATSFGFHDLVAGLLTAAGYAVTTRWASRVEEAEVRRRERTVYRPEWGLIDELVRGGFEFRHRQREALEVIAAHENGRIDCHPGWGKGTLIMLAARLFPRAKVDVVTKRVPVLLTRLYPELSLHLPSVGVVGGGRRVTGRRVMCYTADSLHHGRADADFVFVDEGHEACADSFAEKLGRYEHARMWAFSGSWDMRLDNKDMRALAMFGPVRLRVPYEEGVAHGVVVPIEVRWEDVIMDENPCAGCVDDTERKRAGVWANAYRNRVIAAVAGRYGPDVQTLITVETVEHALRLAELLPDFTPVYSGQSLRPREADWFRRHFPRTFVEMTADELRRRTVAFERGELRKAVATTVWNVGVDFRHLEVLIRADAGGSPINDVQIPGRNSRKKREGDDRPKAVGVVHDFLDQFDVGFRRRAERRAQNYARNGWRQVYPDRSRRGGLRAALDLGGSP